MADTEVSTTPIWVDGTVTADNIRAGYAVTPSGGGLRSTSTITLTGMGGNVSNVVHVQATVVSRVPGHKKNGTGMLGVVVRNPTNGADPTFVLDTYRLSGTDAVEVYWFAVRSP